MRALRLIVAASIVACGGASSTAQSPTSSPSASASGSISTLPTPKSVTWGPCTIAAGTPSPSASASGVTAIDDVDLDVVIAHIHGRFRSCLARARKVDPQAGGLNKIAIELGPDGHVTNTAVVCSDSAPQLAECLRASFIDVLFTPPKVAPARHVVPIVLQSH